MLPTTYQELYLQEKQMNERRRQQLNGVHYWIDTLKKDIQCCMELGKRLEEIKLIKKCEELDELVDELFNIYGIIEEERKK